MNKVQKQSVGSLQDYHLFILGYYSHYPFYPNYKKLEIHFCQLCNTGTDSIVHHIFECGETMELWLKHFNSQRTPQFIIGNQHLNKKELIALNEYINEVVQKVKRRRKFTNLESWGEARCGRRNKYTCLAITTRQLDFIRKLPIQ